MWVVKEGPVAEGFGAKGFQWWLYERGLCPDWKGDTGTATSEQEADKQMETRRQKQRGRVGTGEAFWEGTRALTDRHETPHADIQPDGLTYMPGSDTTENKRHTGSPGDPRLTSIISPEGPRPGYSRQSTRTAMSGGTAGAPWPNLGFPTAPWSRSGCEGKKGVNQEPRTGSQSLTSHHVKLTQNKSKAQSQERKL